STPWFVASEVNSLHPYSTGSHGDDLLPICCERLNRLPSAQCLDLSNVLRRFDPGLSGCLPKVGRVTPCAPFMATDRRAWSDAPYPPRTNSQIVNQPDRHGPTQMWVNDSLI